MKSISWTDWGWQAVGRDGKTARIDGGAKKKDNIPYIKDGLVLWLDGIQKGGVVNQWIDQISGYSFDAVNGVIFDENHVRLDASQQQWLENLDFVAPEYTNATIEIAIEPSEASFSSMLFSPSTSRRIALEAYNSGIWRILWATSNQARRARLTMGQAIKTANVNSDFCLVNGEPIQIFDSAEAVGTSQKNTIGARISGNGAYQLGYTGKIFALRIYDRKLSQIESMANVRADNERFNLGLSV